MARPCAVRGRSRVKTWQSEQKERAGQTRGETTGAAPVPHQNASPSTTYICPAARSDSAFRVIRTRRSARTRVGDYTGTRITFLIPARRYVRGQHRHQPEHLPLRRLAEALEQVQRSNNGDHVFGEALLGHRFGRRTRPPILINRPRLVHRPPVQPSSCFTWTDRNR